MGKKEIKRNKGGTKLFKKTQKKLSVLVVLAIVLSMFASVALAATAPYNVFSSGFTSVTTGNNKAGGQLTVSERQADSWNNNIHVSLQLPEGVTYNTKATAVADYVYSDGTLTLEEASDSSLRVKAVGASYVQFLFNVADKSALNIASDFTGDVKATVDVYEIKDSAVQWIESDSRTIARVVSKNVTVKAAAATIVQMGTNKSAAKITIQENTASSLDAGEEIRLEIVTSGVKFAALPTITSALVDALPAPAVWADANNRQVKFTVDRASAVFASKIEIASLLNIDPTVTSGDVEIRVRSIKDGSAITSTTVTVATVGSTEVQLTEAANNTKTIYAGHQPQVLKVSSNNARFDFKATGGSLISEGKIVVFELNGATFDKTAAFKVQSRASSSVSFADVTVQPTLNFYSSDTKVWFEVGDWNATELRFTALNVYADGDADAGDITLKVSGNLGVTGEVTLGKVAKPFAVGGEIAKLSYPGMNQTGTAITITEAAREAILAGKLYVELPSGVEFVSKPRVKVTTGDLTINTSTSTLNADGVLVIDVSGKSTEASTITIDNFEYNVARAAFEGNVTLKVTGEDTVWVDDAVLASGVVARVGIVAGSTVFTIGSADYVVDGKTLAMDVAPFIKDGRTFLPLRFAADAAGTEEILWDAARKTVTLIRGDRVVQVTVGSTTMLINGAAVTMDVAPEIVDGRTMLPIRWVGMALRANVNWNDAAKTVTVTPY
jgi:hypothetical protein